MPNREVGGYYTSQARALRRYESKINVTSVKALSSSVTAVTVADILTSNDIPVSAGPVTAAISNKLALAGLRILTSTGGGGKIELKLANASSAAVASMTARLWWFTVDRAPGL